MAVTPDIFVTYRHPRQVIRRLVDAPAHEGRALAFLMLGCALIFVAQLPRVSRAVAQGADEPFAALATGELVWWVFFAPLIFYGLTALTRLVAHLLGGKGTGYSARMAGFWALVAASPLWLLRGLVAAFIGPSPALEWVTLVALVAHVAIWAVCWHETEWRDRLVSARKST